MFVKAEVLFHYEHGSTFRIYDASFDKLLGEVSNEDYTRYKYVDRICCEQVLAFAKYENIDLKDEQSRLAFTNYLKPFVPDVGKLMEQLCSFAHIEAKLPSHEKQYIPSGAIEIATTQNREEIIDYLQNIRQSNITADLAFYAYRDMAT